MSDVPPGRLVLVVLALAYVVVGPMLRHFGPVTRSEALPGWFMFRGAFVDTCQVEFYVRDGGEDRRVRAWETLGTWSRRTLHDPKEVGDLARQLCNRLGTGTDLRADARCGGYAGWKRIHGRERDLCPR